MTQMTPARKVLPAPIEGMAGYGIWAFPEEWLLDMPEWMPEAIKRYPLTGEFPPLKGGDLGAGGLTQISLAALCWHLSLGAPLSECCAVSGVNITQVRYWRKEANLSPGYVWDEAVLLMEKAKADFTMRSLGRINKASEDEKHWTAAAWLLERHDPQRWGQYRRIEQKVESVVTNNVVIYIPDNERNAELSQTIEGQAQPIEDEHGSVGKLEQRTLYTERSPKFRLDWGDDDEPSLEETDRESYREEEA